MRRFYIAVFAVFLALPQNGQAQQSKPILAADPMLIDSGFLKYLLPRFSLKTSVRIDLLPLAQAKNADMVLRRNRPDDNSGKPAVRAGELVFYITSDALGEKSQRFVDWLLSDIGQRTVGAFKQEGKQVFSGAADLDNQPKEVVLTGDAILGKQVSFGQCGRCHVIGPENKMAGVGSTPSFALMRAFPDWLLRFETFYTRIPHPSFTQITGITDPFSDRLPPSIVPIELSPEELEALVAFVAAIAPADLGAPLVHQ